MSEQPFSQYHIHKTSLRAPKMQK